LDSPSTLKDQTSVTLDLSTSNLVVDNSSAIINNDTVWSYFKAEAPVNQKKLPTLVSNKQTLDTIAELEQIV